MNNIDDFISSKNKATLWSLLYERGEFSKFSSSQLPTIQNLFDNIIGEHSRISSKNESVLNLNKQVLPKIITAITNVPPLAQTQQQDMYNNINNNNNNVNLITQEEIQQNRQQKLQQDLYAQEQHLKNTITLKKPAEIDFSEDITDGPKDMSKALENMIHERQKKFNQIIPTEDTTEVQSWINREVKIGNDTDIKSSITTLPSEPTKSVSFNNTIDEIPNTSDDINFLQNLKQESSIDNKLNEKLNTIIANQEKIIGLLRS